MFRRILIANRGEIACRVIRTAHRLGVETVAVYSDADRDARHVRLADAARRVGPPPARESYLDAEAILAAARSSGAEAIHPGYGFLAENERFAAACRAAGVIFIGPSPEAIAAMGDKAAANRLMEKAGVPLVPGYHGAGQDAKHLAREARRIGFPVLIKPSAGGGGKGMRIVRDADGFAGELEAARREARAAFGDDRVLIERYLERARHIEVQVFGDAHGRLVYLFERDCSVQRRHQKILEEAPAPGLSAARRREMGEVALAAASAIGYAGAGTVEFIAAQDGRFYFLEMNTRLQVEHPVTEMVTGLDLVEWQLRVAAGEPLPKKQDEIALRGHAIEARIYAEDPARDFLPQSGRLAHFAFPEETEALRFDTGFEAGAEIPPFYDPMIAKLVVRGDDRADALARLRAALPRIEIAGVTTNVEFLGRIAACRAYADAELDTGLIERNGAELFAPRAPLPEELLAAAAFAEIAAEQAAARQRSRASGDPHSPWHGIDGWRLNEDSRHGFSFTEGGTRHGVTVNFGPQGLRVAIGGRSHSLAGESLADGRILLSFDGRAVTARALRLGRDLHVFCDGMHRILELQDEHRAEDKEAFAGSLAAPMPGRVIQVLAKPGARVARGAPLVVLEAMKMEHTITAPKDGVVKEVHYAAGDQVLEGAILLRLE